MILYIVGDSDPSFVGEAEGSSGCTVDVLRLEGISVFADGRNEGTEAIGVNVAVGTDDIEGSVVGNSDPSCVGEAEGSSDSTVDVLRLEGISVFIVGRNEGTEVIPLGETVAVGTDDVEGSVVGNSDPLCVGRAEGLSDSTMDVLRLEGISVFVDGRNEGTEVIPLGETVAVGTGDIEGNIV